MFEKLNHIELSGESYPIKCDLLVLEKIQDEYGDLSDFENKLTGFVPDIDEYGEYVRNEEGLLVGKRKTPDDRRRNGDRGREERVKRKGNHAESRHVSGRTRPDPPRRV